MKNIEIKRFFFFIGFAIIFYLIIFFPDKNEDITLLEIIIDGIKSISVSFVTVYVTNWLGNKYPRRIKE